MEVVELNVGGTLFTTSRATLTSRSNSMLARMFEGELSPAQRDTSSRYRVSSLELSAQCHSSMKNGIVKEREDLKRELEMVTGKLDDSLEATERTFNFCHFALKHFNTGTLQTKREIFTTIGSNMVLKDKKLIVGKFSPYMIIENGILEQKKLKDTLVPKNHQV